MSLNINPINTGALSAYAGSKIGNLGLDFGRLESPNYAALISASKQRDQNSGLGEVLSGLGQGLGALGGNQREDAQRQQAMAFKSAEAEKDRAAMMERMKFQARAKQKLVDEALGKAREELQAAKAKNNDEAQLKKRAAFNLNYLNSPDIINDEELSTEYFQQGVKKGIITEDESIALLNQPPKARMIGMQLDTIASTGALTIKQENKKKNASEGSISFGEKKTPKKALSPQQAGYGAGIQPGYDDIQKAKEIFYNKDGDVDLVNLWTAQSTPKSMFGIDLPNLEGVPGTKGKTGRQAMTRALTTKLRLESGAAVPDSEIERYESMFLPSPTDSKEAIDNKFKSLEQWYNNVNESINPNMSPEEKLDAMYKKAQDVSGQGQENPLSGYTEEDIKTTMDKYGITREELIKRVNQMRNK